MNGGHILQTARTRTVLIVEDETLIRMDIADIIGGAGFTTLEAGSADEALEVLEQNTEIDLLFSDVDMPGSMDGLELAKVVHERWPLIGLLLSSGNRSISQNDLPAGGAFLPKPWNEQALLNEIHAALAT
jgi:CheY-like chemotaxis protein